MKGKLIVCEGLDAAGKTTIIEEALKRLDKYYIYNKGLISNTIIGKLAPKIPSTFSFMAELAYNTNLIIKPKLRQGYNVLQDRYDLSVLSYIPSAEKSYNKSIAKFFNNFLLKPDILAYFTVSEEERIKRLSAGPYNKYHEILINNPGLIRQREEKYCELYDSFNGKKFKIDTTNRSIDDVVDEFISKVRFFS